jgi:glycine hydroxymethyltransferase
MELLSQVDPEIARFICAESRRQHDKIRLIASENYVSQAVLEATGSVLTNKYSEGYPGRRYYEGQQYVDKVEALCIARAKALFGAEHVNVQPYSGSPANQAVFVALLKPGDTIMGLSLAHGGHLTHGDTVSISGMHYKAVQYGVRQDTGEIDYEEVERLAGEHRPRLIICGHSAYPRLLDFERFSAIARQVGALLMADIAHIAGLVVAGVHPSPIPYADVVTTTTHKSLRGPRGGMVLCRAQHAEAIDKAVFPGLQGGPHNHTTAAIAVALREAATEDFRQYAARIVENAQVLAAALQRQGFRVLTGGTQNHLVVVDATSMGVTGRQLAKAMDAAGLVCNFNRIPFDTQPALHPSGVRLGTPATTSRGFGPEQMEQIAAWMAQVARVRADAGKDLEARKKAYKEIAAQVKAVCDRFPAPGLLYGPEGKPV